MKAFQRKALLKVEFIWGDMVKREQYCQGHVWKCVEYLNVKI